jgi:hypothetical protein
MGNKIPQEHLAAMLNSILENNEDWQYHPGAVIHRRRTDLGYSVQAVAGWSDSTRKTLENIEKKEVCNSSWHKVISALNVLGIQVYFRVVTDENGQIE